MSIKTFALIAGVAFLALGVLGFVPAMVSPPPANAPVLGISAFHGYVFGLFPVNYMDNLMYLAIGAWGIAAARAVGGSRAYARILAAFFGVLAVMGTIPALNTVFGLLPIHGNDVWLHAGTAICAALFGWAFRSSAALRPTA